MTDDTTRNPAPGDEEQTTPVAEAMADARAALSRKGFSSPTGMIALAALLLIGVEVLFGLILAAYWVNAAMLSVAVAVTFIYYAKGAYERIAHENALLKLLGMVMAVQAAFHILEVIRVSRSVPLAFGATGTLGIPQILALLFVAAAGVLAFLGAREIE
jgi:hypothetical protein